MPKYDRAFIDASVERLKRIDLDAPPEWGEMTAAQMMGHVNMMIIYSLGKLPALPSMGGWFTRNLVGPILLNGIMKMPKNLKPKLPEGSPEPPPPPSGNIDLLTNALEMFYEGLESGEIESPPHPAFGDIGVEGWAKLHCVHLDHHLRQFGV